MIDNHMRHGNVTYKGDKSQLEIWKDIEGYEGIYQISNLGRVKSLKFGKEKILKQSNIPDMYKTLALCKKGDVKMCRVHRLIAKAFIPNPENKPQVNHIDGNKKNNSIENLEWVTHKENMQHAYLTGLTDVDGEKNAMSKLTENEVLQIRSIYEQGFASQTQIANSYGVGQQLISLITSRKRWKNI